MQRGHERVGVPFGVPRQSRVISDKPRRRRRHQAGEPRHARLRAVDPQPDRLRVVELLRPRGELEAAYAPQPATGHEQARDVERRAGAAGPGTADGRDEGLDVQLPVLPCPAPRNDEELVSARPPHVEVLAPEVHQVRIPVSRSISRGRGRGGSRVGGLGSRARGNGGQCKGGRGKGDRGKGARGGGPRDGDRGCAGHGRAAQGCGGRGRGSRVSGCDRGAC
mmetsp:Transcript_103852/g.293709  ORF Transcript_103852/g.293709 Transcript_103852/m.293709 type:complete len:222 (-) Transcript_103852:625-1290(-)